jgi:hypothetical protein
VTERNVKSTVAGEQTGAGLVITTEGASGTGGMTTEAEGEELHPAEFVTTNVYDPGISPLIVVDPPDPVTVTPAGTLVIVQLPAGKPVSTTLPSGEAQVGVVIAPGTGGCGVGGCGLITMFEDSAEVHPDWLVTVKL